MKPWKCRCGASWPAYTTPEAFRLRRKARQVHPGEPCKPIEVVEAVVKTMTREEFEAAFQAEAEATGRRPLRWEEWKLVGTFEEAELGRILGTGCMYQLWMVDVGGDTKIMVEWSPSGPYPYASFRWVLGEFDYGDALRAIADREEAFERGME